MARTLDEVIDSLPSDQQDEIAAAATQLNEVETTLSGLDALATEANAAAPRTQAGGSASALTGSAITAIVENGIADAGRCYSSTY